MIKTLLVFNRGTISWLIDREINFIIFLMLWPGLEAMFSTYCHEFIEKLNSNNRRLKFYLIIEISRNFQPKLFWLRICYMQNVFFLSALHVLTLTNLFFYIELALLSYLYSKANLRVVQKSIWSSFSLDDTKNNTGASKIRINLFSLVFLAPVWSLPTIIILFTLFFTNHKLI